MTISIEEIPRNKPHHLDRLRLPRCECITKSCGTWYFEGKQEQCARFAQYKIDGKNLCKQHAGDAALRFLLDNKAEIGCLSKS